MNLPDQTRILAIAPSSRGFGLAVLEGNTLLDCGGTAAVGDKNRQLLLRLEKWLDLYQPDVLILPEVTQRTNRIQSLIQDTLKLASQRQLKVVVISKPKVRRLLLGQAKVTNHEAAKFIAGQFPQPPAPRLPNKRKAWQSEDGRMDVFAALALAMAFRKREK